MPKLPVLKAQQQLKHMDGRRTTIPFHPAHEIRRGTLKAIIDDLNMSVEEFIKAIKK